MRSFINTYKYTRKFTLKKNNNIHTLHTELGTDKELQRPLNEKVEANYASS